MMKKYLLSAILVIPFFLGCSDKFDTNLLGNTSGLTNISGDTSYVPVNPAWGGFNNPQAILIGKEPYIYVCDTDNNRIVMLNTAGDQLGAIGIKKPIAIAQDYRLNLIVCGQFDTLINGVSQTFSAVYKIDLFSAHHIIANAPVKRILPRTIDFNFPLRQYTAAAAFFDNSYYIARIGPNNTSIGDPDNAILQFVPLDHNNDSAYGSVHDINPISTGLISANGINCMTTFNKKNIDFIATYSSETAFKAQWFFHYSTPASEGYVSKFDPKQGMKFAQPNRFGSPNGSCLDPSGNIYISDAIKDSVFKFSAFGDELQSFGGPSVLQHPAGVAFSDRTLYVLDSGSNQILRFILSTDIGQ
jgi:hypothetical protein